MSIGLKWGLIWATQSSVAHAISLREAVRYPVRQHPYIAAAINDQWRLRK